MSRSPSDPSAVRGAIAPGHHPLPTRTAPPDLDTIARLVEFQLQAGLHGISVGGSTGEPGSQTVEERVGVTRGGGGATIGGRVPFPRRAPGRARLDETLGADGR